MKIAIISGASSGMGMEFVKEISKKNQALDEIWVIARREEKLQYLQKCINKRLRILPLDLSEADSMEIIKSILAKKQPVIKYLVNSAGFGKIGYFREIPFEDNMGMIDVNIKALTALTYICLPYLKRNSRIINLASSAGFLPQSRFAVYAASKAYVLSFSRALAHELKARHISVTAVCPGPVKTEFFNIAEETGKIASYKSLAMADARSVVKLALADSCNNKEVSVYGPVMKTFRLAAKILPHRLILEIMDKIQ